MSEKSPSYVWLIAGGGLVLVVILVVIALARDPVQLDPATPEGTLQIYLQAVSDGDYEQAFSLVHPDWVENCSAADLAFVAPDEPFTAALVDSDENVDNAVVEVIINQDRSPGPFDPGSSGFTELFTVERIEGDWLITGQPWPYFSWRCEQP